MKKALQRNPRKSSSRVGGEITTKFGLTLQYAVVPENAISSFLQNDDDLLQAVVSEKKAGAFRPR